MFAKFFNTKITHSKSKYLSERDLPRQTKTELFSKCGITKLWFILEGDDFYYYWNIILLNSSLSIQFNSILSQFNLLFSYTPPGSCARVTGENLLSGLN